MSLFGKKETVVLKSEQQKDAYIERLEKAHVEYDVFEDMVRLFTLLVGEEVKVGIEAQSPAGEGGLRCFSNISLEQRTVRNLRTGI